MEQSEQAPQKRRDIDYFAIKFPINNFVDHRSASDGLVIHNYRWPATEGKPPRGVISML